jgi:hypothetical protein
LRVLFQHPRALQRDTQGGVPTNHGFVEISLSRSIAQRLAYTDRRWKSLFTCPGPFRFTKKIDIAIQVACGQIPITFSVTVTIARTTRIQKRTWRQRQKSHQVSQPEPRRQKIVQGKKLQSKPQSRQTASEL